MNPVSKSTQRKNNGRFDHERDNEQQRLMEIGRLVDE